MLILNLGKVLQEIQVLYVVFGVPTTIVAATNMQFTTKQAAIKRDSLFLAFHISYIAHAICV